MVHLSDAQRTQETWALMSSVSAGCPTTTEPALYLAGLSAIRVAAQSWAPEETGPVLVLGHNPGWEQAASTLSGQPITMTTGNAVLLEGQGASWAEALHDSWRVRAILRPRTLDSDALRDKRDPA